MKRVLLAIAVLAIAGVGAFLIFERTPVTAGNDQTKFTPISPQYLAVLSDPQAKSGTGAETWGYWRVDPGPRGVTLSRYESLKEAGGVAPAKWQFDGTDWWLEEHGLIMESPDFPVAPGKYLVTGDREATAVLTVHPKDAAGAQRWELSDNATIYDVTHLACRSARYTPMSANSCSPEKAQQQSFPVRPGAEMPAVEGCNKQDYAVLIVIGLPEEI